MTEVGPTLMAWTGVPPRLGVGQTADMKLEGPPLWDLALVMEQLRSWTLRNSTGYLADKPLEEAILTTTLYSWMSEAAAVVSSAVTAMMWPSAEHEQQLEAAQADLGAKLAKHRAPNPRILDHQDQRIALEYIAELDLRQLRAACAESPTPDLDGSEAVDQLMATSKHLSRLVELANAPSMASVEAAGRRARERRAGDLRRWAYGS